MDRSLIYTGELPRSTDILYAQRAALLGMSKLSKLMLGSDTMVEGLACAPTNPASMSVSVGPGQIYQMASLDATAYGSLAADSHAVLKQGVMLDAITLACPAPTTTGYSINYLIQATYSDSDTNPLVLPYYNSANPSQAFSGPGNNGATQPTQRQGLITLTAKAGAAAATGSQSTPAVDVGYVGLYVVTVASNATSITASNISQIPGAPMVSNLLAMLQTASAVYAIDTGAANAYVATPTPGNAALVDGMAVRFLAKNANTGASTLNWSGTGAKPLQGMNGPLQGGEIVVNGTYDCIWSAGLAAWVIVGQTGGAVQVGNATDSKQAVALGQVMQVAPQSLGLGVATPAASTTYTLSGSFTAPCAGWVVALSSCAISGTLAAGANIQTYNAINGNNGSGDNNPYPQTMQTNVLAVSAGAAVNVNSYAITNATAPGQAIQLHLQIFFLPNP